MPAVSRAQHDLFAQTVGSVANRRSTLWRSRRTVIRPFCGTRFSVMSTLVHDFQAGDGGDCTDTGYVVDLVENSVDAESDAQSGLGGFQVQIGRAVLDRLLDEGVDVTHDRSIGAAVEPERRHLRGAVVLGRGAAEVAEVVLLALHPVVEARRSSLRAATTGTIVIPSGGA